MPGIPLGSSLMHVTSLARIDARIVEDVVDAEAGLHDKHGRVTTQKPSRRIGLARALSKLGYCSRSDASDLIRAGRVRLNGAVRGDPEAPVQMDKDRIEVDGRPLATAAKIYLMLNKPRGVVTTRLGRKGTANRLRVSKDGLPWVAPVGRLDKASEGLLLLTNDSEWAARVQAPATHLYKTYHVQIDRVAEATLLESLSRGVKLEDGDVLRVRKVGILRSGQRNSWLEIVLRLLAEARQERRSVRNEARRGVAAAHALELYGGCAAREQHRRGKPTLPPSRRCRSSNGGLSISARESWSKISSPRPSASRSSRSSFPTGPASASSSTKIKSIPLPGRIEDHGGLSAVPLRQKFETMAESVSAKAHLRRLGQLFSETVLLEIDGNEFYLTFEKGRVIEIKEGPSLKTSWRFALRANGDAAIEVLGSSTSARLPTTYSAW